MRSMPRAAAGLISAFQSRQKAFFLRPLGRAWRVQRFGHAIAERTGVLLELERIAGSAAAPGMKASMRMSVIVKPA